MNAIAIAQGSALRATRSVREQVSPAEWDARVQLAAAYRLTDHYAMTELVSNHISCRVPGEEGHFLINGYGLLYEEITASNLIKVDLDGKVLFNASDYGVNGAGFVIHSAIHAARHDVDCVAHTHTQAGMAISAMDCGLLPISQTTMRFLHVAHHAFEGIADDPAERERLVADLGQHNAMVLRNHGLLVCGSSVAAAFMNLWRMERSCQTQIMAMSCGQKLVFPPPEVSQLTYERMAGLHGHGGGQMTYSSPWPALLRKLDRIDPSYKD
jgi:ribulose-5-phosphate 4-epimerase/fuculose-1-phosphate aldolase